MAPYETITQLIGNIALYAGGSVAVSYALFIFLGKHWIDNRFARDLEKYKREQESELEKLRLKINTLFNKVLKTQEREYDILPTLWSKLQKLRREVSIAVSVLKELPDLNIYDKESLERFIKDNEIPESVAKNLHTEENKIKVYNKYLDLKQMHKAHKAFDDFDEYYETNKIFLSTELKEKFSQIHTHLWSVWVDRKMSLDEINRPHDFWIEANKGMKEKVIPLLNEIEDLVQKHLYNHEI
jgi:hypothetical protein